MGGGANGINQARTLGYPQFARSSSRQWPTAVCNRSDIEIKAHIAFAKGADQMLNALRSSPVAEVATAASNQIRQYEVLGDLEISDVIAPQVIDRMSVPATMDW